MPDVRIEHADLLGFEFDTDRGRAKVIGTTTWSNEYVLIESVDGDWRSARPAKQVRQALDRESSK